MDFSNGINGFFHSLIPAKLREDLVPGSADYIRVRALSAMLSMITFISGLSLIIISSYHWLFSPELLKNDLVQLSTFLLFAIQAWLFYRFNNYWMSGLAFTNFYFLLIAVLLIVSGGYEAVGKHILITCPMVSFLIGGRQEGLQNTFFTVLFGIGLMILELIDFKLPNIFSNEEPHIIFMVSWVVTVFIISICVTVYEAELENHEQS